MSDIRRGKPSSSEAHRIIACPGYLYAKANWENIPDTTSDIAQSGTNTHEAIECMIDGKPVEISLNSIEEYVATKCATMQDNLTLQLFGSLDAIKEHFVKTRLWLKHNGEDVMSGEPDYFGHDGNGRWLLVDYKRGPKPVPVATANWQIQSYCAKLAYDEQFKHHKIDVIYGVILQPLVSTKPVVVKMSIDDCLNIRAKLITAILNADNKDMPRVPGDHCTYCPVRHKCPQAQSFGMLLSHKFELDGSLSNAQLLQIYPKLNQIIDICDKVKDLFKQRVASGEIDGYEIYDHPAGYTVEHPNDLWALVKDYFKDGKEFTSLLSVPMGAVKDVWISRFAEASGCSRKEADAEWKKQIEPHLIAKKAQKRVRKIREG